MKEIVTWEQGNEEKIKEFALTNPLESEIGFEHEGTWIVNPWYDSTGRYSLNDQEAVAEYGLDNVLNFISMATKEISQDMFKSGDIVKIKDKWLDTPAGRKFRYIVTDVNEKTKRCYIKCVNSDLPLSSEDLVSFDMIERITDNRIVYSVVFHRADGNPREEYEYNDLREAKKHFDLFRDDTSGLYDHINLTETVIGLPEIVLQTICFNVKSST